MGGGTIGGAIGGVIGGTIGFFVGQPFLGFSLGASLGAGIGSAISPQILPTVTNEGTRMDTAMVQQSSYGQTVNFVTGTCRAAGMLMWCSDLMETRHVSKQTVKTGGKGGGAKQTVENVWYTYAVNAAVVICEGPIFGVRRIWADTELVYSKHEDADADTDALSNAFAQGFTLYLGTADQLPDPLLEASIGADMVPGYRNIAYIVFENFDVTNTGGRLPNFTFEVVTDGHYPSGDVIVPDDVALADIITDLVENYSVLTASDIDVTDVDQLVKGYLINQQCNIRAAMEPLLLAYYVDAFESEGKVKFISRGNASALTIPRDKLIPIKSGQNEGIDLVVVERIDEKELPKKVTVACFNRENDYEQVTGSFSRQATISKVETSQTFGLSLTEAEASGIAEVLCHVAWTHRSAVQFTLPLDYLKLDVSDVITVTSDTQSYVIRITRVEIGQNELQCEGVYEDREIYSPVSVSALTDTSKKLIAKPGETLLYFLDIPLIDEPGREWWIQAGYYLAATGAEPWAGCTIQKKIAGVWYDYTSFDVYSVCGQTKTVLTGSSVPFVVTGDTVDVELVRGTLSSVTKDQLFAGDNLAAIGSEIIAFQTATLISGSTYRLSNIIRGRFGTEWAMAGHALYDDFMLLDHSVKFMPTGLHEIGIEQDYKAYSQTAWTSIFKYQDPPEPITDHQFTWQGESMRPRSSVHIYAERGWDGARYINWTRRERLDGTWRDIVDVSNYEPTMEFEVRIMDGAAIKRIIPVTDALWATYSAADQTTDFGSVQPSIDVNIYRYSARVGLGRVGSATI